MWHDLAIALGGRTVDEWQQTMSAVEFAAWMEYCTKKPLPVQRADLRTARQTTEIAGMMGAKNVKLSDFMFDFDGVQGDGGTSTGRSMSQDQVSHLLDTAAAKHVQDGYGKMIDGDSSNP
tara:strand:+ start:1919 stop:2278 length:360 start_codon:yes stop_codon:yes gene_type:complete